MIDHLHPPTRKPQWRCASCKAQYVTTTRPPCCMVCGATPHMIRLIDQHEEARAR